jgi:large subunit ribosomal protein L21
MKYAIVESGGKQFKAVEGSTILVDLLSAEVGQQVTLESVLLVADENGVMVGTPTVSGAKVNTTVVALDKGPKLTVFRYRPKKRIRVKTGHRQKYTRLQVNAIELEAAQ